MVPSRRTLSLLVGAVLLPSCAPPAGLNPAPTGGAAPVAGPPAAVAPSAPVGAASPPAPGASPPAPAPTAPAARRRLLGAVTLNGQPVPDASLTAWDLATGQAVPLGAWASPAPGSTLATVRTDAAGAFDLALPPLAAGQVVQLMARTGSQTFLALVDAQGRLLATPARGYRLAQTGGLTLRLGLTPASTAGARAFLGVFKLQLQRPVAAREAGLAQAFEAASRALAALEAALAKQPTWATDLVAGGGAASADALRAALGRLGVYGTLDEAVRGELARLPLEPIVVAPGATPVTADDFPLDRPTISAAGELAFSGLSQALRLGGEPVGWVATPERRRRRQASPRGFWLVDMGRPGNIRNIARWYTAFYDARRILLAHANELRVYDTGTGVLSEVVATAGGLVDPAATATALFRGAVPEPGRSTVLAHVEEHSLQRGTPVDASLSRFTWEEVRSLQSDLLYGGLRRFGGRLFLPNEERTDASLYELVGTPPATVPVPVGHPPVERLPASSRCFDVAFDSTPGLANPPFWALIQDPIAGNPAWTSIWKVTPGTPATNALLLEGIYRARTLAFSWRRRELYVSVYDAEQVGTATVVTGADVLAVDVDTGATHLVEWENGPALRPVSGLTVSPDGEAIYGFML